MQDPLIKDILDDLESRFSGNIVSVFGIGSYFDENLPPNWIKNDVDLVVIVDSLEGDPQFRFTSIVKIAEKIKQLVSSEKICNIFNAYFEEAVIYRITSQFKSEFKSLRDDFVKFVFSSLESGSVHQKMKKTEIIELLSESFSGLGYLVRFARKFTNILKKS